MTNMRDGLGGEEVRTESGAGFVQQSSYFTGSVVCNDRVIAANVIASTALSGASAYLTNVVASTLLSGTGVNTAVISGTNFRGNNEILNGSIAFNNAVMNYAPSNKVTVNNVPAETIITGGQWVMGSARVGGPLVCKASVGGQPLGVCGATVASGGFPEIIIRGFVSGLIAEATVNTGDGFAVGTGAALNCIKAAAAGLVRGMTLQGAGSEGAACVYLY